MIITLFPVLAEQFPGHTDVSKMSCPYQGKGMCQKFQHSQTTKLLDFVLMKGVFPQ